MVESPIICDCNTICRSVIEDEIKEKKLKTIDEVAEKSGAGTVCGGCQIEIQEILNEINN